MKVKLHIYRADPSSNKEPEYQTFEVDAEPEETISGVLQYIYENIDPTLAFRFVCNMQKCGVCAVAVNKSPCLACERRVEPEMTIDPLPNLPVIKDLVIDRHKVISSIFNMAPLLKKSGTADTGLAASTETPDIAIKLGECIECLVCQSVCPVIGNHPETFVGPLGLLWLTQKSIYCPSRTSDWDKEIGNALEMCNFCGRCWKVCPHELNVLDSVFEKLKHLRRRK